MPMIPFVKYFQVEKKKKKKTPKQMCCHNTHTHTHTHTRYQGIRVLGYNAKRLHQRAYYIQCNVDY